MKLYLFQGASKELTNQWWQHFQEAIKQHSFFYFVASEMRRKEVRKLLGEVLPFFSGIPPVESFRTFLFRRSRLFCLHHLPETHVLGEREVRLLLEEILRKQTGRDQSFVQLAIHFSKLLLDIYLSTPLSIDQPVEKTFQVLSDETFRRAILLEYSQRLQDRQWLDQGLALRLFLRRLYEHPALAKVFLPKAEWGFFEHLYEISPLEEAFLQWASEHWLKHMSFLFVSKKSKAPHWRPSQRLESLLASLGEVTQKVEEEIWDPLEEPGKKGNLQISISYHFNREKEVFSIARKVCALREAGVLEKDILIVFPNLSVYLPYVEEIFPLFSLNFAVSKGESLKAHPLTRFLFCLASLSQSELYLPRILDLCASPFPITVKTEQGKVELTPTLVEEVARLGKITGHHLHHWQKGIERGRKVLELLENPPFSVKEYERKTQALLHFFQLLPKKEEFSSPLSFAKHLEKLFSALSLPWSLFHPTLLEKSPFLLRRLYEVWNTFTQTIESTLDHLTFLKEQGFSLDFRKRFLELLRQKLEEATLPPLFELQPGRLWIVSPEEALFCFPRYLFLGGFLDGEFPRTLPLHLFSKTERLLLGWEDHRIFTTELDKITFLRLLAETKEHLCLSVPELEGDLPLLPSPLLYSLLPHLSSPPKEAEKSSVHDYYLALGKSWRSGENLEEHLSQADLFLRHRIWAYTQRENPSHFTIYNGWIEKPRLKEKILTKLQCLSVSQLETFARCPYRFFLERLVRLKKIEEIRWEVSPLEKGTFLHRVLHQFFLIWQSQHNTPLTLSQWEKAWELLYTALQKVQEEPPFCFFDSASWQAYLHSLTRKEGGILHEWLLHECESSLPHIPKALEWEFGTEETPFEISLSLGDKQYSIPFQGRIDRVDLVTFPDGSKGLVVGDYKTGTPPKSSDIQQGKSYQLSLYLAAVRKYFPSFPLVGGYYFLLAKPFEVKRFYCIGKPGKKWNHATMEENTQAALSLFEEHLVKDLQGMLSGWFPTTSERDGSPCQFCPARRICTARSGLWEFLEEEELKQFALRKSKT